MFGRPIQIVLRESYKCCNRGHEEVVSLLLANNAHITLELLTEAAKHNSNMLSIIISGGGKEMVNFTDDWGRTPLHYAVGSGQAHNVKLLLRQGSVPHDEVQQVLRVVFKLP